MFKLFSKLRAKDLALAILAAGFVVVQIWMELTIPDYMSDITKLVQTEGSLMSDILLTGGKMLLCALVSLVASAITAILSAKVATDFSFDLREKLFNRVQSFSMEEIGRFSTASLITRSTNDVNQVQMVIAMGLHIIIKVPVMSIWAIGKIAGKASQWTFATGTAVVVQTIIVLSCVSIAIPKIKQLQALTDDLNRVTRENLTGLKVVRAYNAEGYQEEKFDESNAKLASTDLFATKTMAFMSPGIQLVMNGLALSVYWIGAYLIDKAGLMDKIQIFSDMVVYSQYAMQIVMSFMMLIIIFMIWPRASVAANRINEVLDTEPTIHDGKGAAETGEKGEVRFEHVYFRYPGADEDVLNDISFEAHKGETVAFIGSTGCGKSTVVNLIPRFYDASEGTVYVDGADVRDYKQKDLRNKIAYISQSAILFTGDISSNIAYGDNGKGEISAQKIKEAAELAQSKDFIEKLENGYNGYVAQGGTNFSGGQKQRISIARAIARDAEILIFDDSFSALDYKTDRALRKTLDEKCKGVTRLIVAQRIGTIRDADRIIVLDDGKIAGIGTHNELMKNCEVYRQIALSQLSEEELA